MERPSAFGASTRDETPGRAASRIALTYVFLAALWILFSDRILSAFVANEGPDAEYWLRDLQTMKGWFFVVTTGALLYVLVRRSQERLRRSREEVRRLNEDLEARVLERTTQLRAVNDELESFSYAVSHDLHAPLRAVDGFSNALAEDCGDQLHEEGRRYLDRIRAAARRMEQIIDDLLNLSRLNRAALHLEEVNLSALARDVVTELRRREPDRCVEVIVAGDLRVNGDSGLLRIALENLLGNAWKYTSKQPAARIDVGTTSGEGQRVYFVRDDGVGFPSTEAEKLFVTFHRCHSDDEFEGAGIGLATVRRIVHRHGGSIWAEGEVGKGATFHFTLGAPAQSEKRNATAGEEFHLDSHSDSRGRKPPMLAAGRR